MPSPKEIPINLADLASRLSEPPPRADRTPPGPSTTPPAGSQADPASHAHPEGVFCPYCGWNQAVKGPTPAPADVAAFRDAVFSGQPYTKRLALFGGAAEVVYRDLSADERRAADVLVAAAILKDPMAATSEGMATLQTSFRIGMAVVSLRLGSKNFVPVPVDDPTTVDMEKREGDLRRACGSETVYRTIREQYGRFLMDLGVIMFRAADRDFYSATGTGGGTPASPQPGMPPVSGTPVSA